MASLDLLLGKLNLGGKASGGGSSFEAALDDTEFTIFQPIADLGYFSWTPKGSSYKSLSDIKSEVEVTCHIDYDGKPDRLLTMQEIVTPARFKSPPSNGFENKFPYGETDIACLHVASGRGVDFDKVDFCFGGSTLEMLANQEASDPFIVTRVPGTKCILVVKKKSYTKDLADLGFQFERYVTGGSMMDSSSNVQIEHLHTMKIGNMMVLFRAEVDAVDSNGSAVEIKASNPRYFGTRVMFQMISSGSSKLCHGEKYRGSLSRVTMRPLSSVAATALQCVNVKKLEKNIIDGMDALKDIDDGIHQVCFVNGSLRLARASSRVFTVLPPENVVKALLKK